MLHKKKEKMFLDISSDKCPITFVKIKIALEKLKKGQYLEILISDGEALLGLPNSLKDLGFIITNKKKFKDNIYNLKISHQS